MRSSLEGKIYYVSGEGKAAAKMIPALEKLKKNDIEVLYMIEPLDEICIQSVRKYQAADGKEYELIDAGKTTINFDNDSETKEKKEKVSERSGPEMKIVKVFTDNTNQPVVSCRA